MSSKGKRRSKKKSKELGLFGVPVETTNKIKDTGIEFILTAASAVAGSGVGAAIGKPSLIASLPIIVFGIYRKNNYITAAGVGMFLSNGFQPKTSSDTTTNGIDDEVDGIEQAKERVSTFFRNFSDKLYLPKQEEATPTNGLGEAPTYFINPYNTQIEGPSEVDMSQLDRVQQEIASMGNLGNPDRIL